MMEVEAPLGMVMAEEEEMVPRMMGLPRPRSRTRPSSMLRRCTFRCIRHQQSPP